MHGQPSTHSEWAFPPLPCPAEPQEGCGGQRPPDGSRPQLGHSGERRPVTGLISKSVLWRGRGHAGEVLGERQHAAGVSRLLLGQ